jgi:hypothetical protein
MDTSKRIQAAWFPVRKSLEEFDFDYARGFRRDLSPTWANAAKLGTGP